MERQYDTKYVYRVWYGGKTGIEKEAFFTDKQDAEDFAKTVSGHVNVWSWQMKIEK